MTRVVKNSVWMTLLMSIACATSSVLAVDVKVRERVAAHGSVVRLMDVAEIKTADPQELRQLGSLPLMPAPAPGTERFLRTREIQVMLAAQGVDVGTLHFAGAAQVDITTAEGGSTPANFVRVSSEARHD